MHSQQSGLYLPGCYRRSPALPGRLRFDVTRIADLLTASHSQACIRRLQQSGPTPRRHQQPAAHPEYDRLHVDRSSPAFQRRLCRLPNHRQRRSPDPSSSMHPACCRLQPFPIATGQTLHSPPSPQSRYAGGSLQSALATCS